MPGSRPVASTYSAVCPTYKDVVCMHLDPINVAETPAEAFSFDGRKGQNGARFVGNENIPLNVISQFGPRTVAPNEEKTRHPTPGRKPLGEITNDTSLVAAKAESGICTEHQHEKVATRWPESGVPVAFSEALSKNIDTVVHINLPNAVSTRSSSSAQKPSRHDIQAVPEYALDIFAGLHEAQFRLRPDYMNCQPDINAKMRGILLDWIVEVQMKFGFREQTLFLTVNYIDRYLSVKRVQRKNLQLVGIVAMFIACKFEEVNPPEVRQFVYITDNAYQKDEVLQMECLMLEVLEFKLMVPTVAHFFEHLMNANKCDFFQQQVVKYILELAILDIHMIRHLPSFLVTSALYLSNKKLGKSPVWPSDLASLSRCQESEIWTCHLELEMLLEAAPNSRLKAVGKKYSRPRYCCVSRCAPLGHQ